MILEPSRGVVVTVTTTALIASAPTVISSLVLTPAAASCTVQLIDPALPGVTVSTGGTLRMVVQAAASGASASYDCSGSGVLFNNGVIAVVTGTGAQANIAFKVI